MQRILLIISICSYLAIDLVRADDWPGFRGPNRDGRSQTVEISSSWKRNKPKLIKEIQGAGKGFASICVGDGKLFTTGNSENSQFVVCYEQKSGAVIWRKELVGVIPNHAVAGSRSTPSYIDNRLYVTTSDGQLYCLDTDKDGKIVWQKSFQKDFRGRLMSGWGYSESPLIDGDRIIVTPGGESALVVALDRENGNEIWRTGLDESKAVRNLARQELKEGAGYSSIIKAKNGLNVPQYIQFVGRGLIGIDCESGKILWQHSSCASRVSNISSPVYADNRVVYSAAPKGGLAILELSPVKRDRLTKPGEIYSKSLLECHHGGMVIHNGHVYFGAGENRGYPTCIELASGKRKWGGSFRGPGRGSASVIFVDEKIIFRYQNGVVAMFAANSKEYQPLGHFTQSVESKNQSWAHPVVVDKQLLLREDDKIMVYDLK